MTNLRLFFLLICYLSGSLTLHAQLEKVVHQTFEVKDSIQTIQFDLVDSLEVESWASNSIMSVAKVELYNGAQHILDFFVKEGRYGIEVGQEDGANMTLISSDKIRKTMEWKGEAVYETVFIKFYFPKDFEWDGQKLVRKPKDPNE